MKKLFISLGACLIAGAVGVGSLLCSKENSNIAKAESDISLDNVVLYTSDERDYSDLPISQSIYWFNGDLRGVDNSHYDQILINASSGAITRIRLRDYNDSENFITLYNDNSLDIAVFEKVYLLQGSIKNMVFGPIGNPTLVDDKSEVYQYLKYAFDVSFVSETPYFNFHNTINYNSPYHNTLGLSYNLDNEMDENHEFKEFELFNYVYNKWFMCAGEYYNVIELKFSNAYNYSFKENGELFKQQGYATFMYLRYFNTITNKELFANFRDFADTTGGSTSYYTLNRSTWRSGEYKTLKLLFTPTSSDLATLNELNNDSYVPSDLYGKESVGLAGAFTLLSQAFKSVASLMSIEVIGGITIGMLLFLPLIVGIIIAIVWIVKR